MKKLLLIIFSIICALQYSHAQKENANWAFSQSAGLTFNTNPPSKISTSFEPGGGYSPTAVSDSNGNLLFYTNGNKVWARNHVMMPNGSDITLGDVETGCGDSRKNILGVAAVPDPANKHRYYIFTTVAAAKYVGPGQACLKYTQARYSIVDMSLRSGMGDVIAGSKNILLMNDGGILTGVTGNGVCDKWVVFKKRTTTEIYAYRITASGIDPVPTITSGFNWIYDNIKFTNNNTKALLEAASGNTANDLPTYLYLYDFDVATGRLSNGIKVDTARQIKNTTRVMGKAFSADNAKMYAYHYYVNGNPTYLLHQYDISLGSEAAIQASKTPITPINFLPQTFDLTLGADNKIYSLFSPLTPATMMVIHHPDKAGTACDVQFHPYPAFTSLQASDGMQSWVPASRVHYAYSDFNTCSFPATLKSQQPVADNYVWSTGATGQSISITQNGTYWVRAEQSCGAHRVDTFHVNFNPPQPIADLHSCDGSPIQVPIDPQATYNWPGGEGPVINKSGTFTVSITKQGCGTIQSTFKATIYPPLGSPLLPADTLVCNPAMSAELNSYHELGNYTWSTGANTHNLNITRPGTYWLSCNSPCGLYTDTINAAFCAPEITDMVSPDTACTGSCISFVQQTNNYPQQYAWTMPGGSPDSHKGSNPGMVCYTNTGSYKVSLTVSNAGGTDTYEKQVLVLPRPVGRFADTPVNVSYKTLLLLPACGEAAVADWYKGDTLLCHNCPALSFEAKEWKTNIRCIIANADCKDSCGYTITVTDIPTDAWFPTAFSPNGDGRNDLFRMITDNPNIQIANMEVYHRWGGRVYRYTEDRRDGWDGTHNGIPQDMGTYAWMMSYKVIGNPKIFTMKGVVTLVR